MKNGLVFAPGSTNARGLYDLYPRAAYYVLREAHNVNPLLKTSLEYVDNAFQIYP
jgi:hypothetical protein